MTVVLVVGIIPACAGNTRIIAARCPVSRDHPRVCGEHANTRASPKTLTGSSPRVRGTLESVSCEGEHRGIIPACAGNTAILKSCRFGIRDHPRVCGEHLGCVRVCERVMGSSPRVRGTRFVDDLPVGQAGIIPACAGNTIRVTSSTRSRWDHPRVCGEHFGKEAILPTKAGSSPRVRGTQSTRFFRTLQSGIIPACAGNTTVSKTSRRRSGDHPRVCGEHARACNTCSLVRGSSPRVRGTLFGGVDDPALRGIIPACAGNTPAWARKKGTPRDHPRVCGEHTGRMRPRVLCAGSSPRVRGTPSVLLPCIQKTRIIPACAGNTRTLGPGSLVIGDHPRVCGEHAVQRRRIDHQRGSSPRVRGTRGQASDLGSRAGIIPACAGNTVVTLIASLVAGDHPRVCGEHFQRFPAFFILGGSSPRVRGTRRTSPKNGKGCRDHPRVCGEHQFRGLQFRGLQGSSPRVRGTRSEPPYRRAATGIIPACAGNTSLTWCSIGATRDHPRVCGEHPSPSARRQYAQGSSPRVRGTLFTTDAGTSINGIIPACAGNTDGGSLAEFMERDHPRVCGEHYYSHSLLSSALGSSPRVRGTRYAVVLHHRRVGIIPACAGNT